MLVSLQLITRKNYWWFKSSYFLIVSLLMWQIKHRHKLLKYIVQENFNLSLKTIMSFWEQRLTSQTQDTKSQSFNISHIKLCVIGRTEESGKFLHCHLAVLFCQGCLKTPLFHLVAPYASSDFHFEQLAEMVLWVFLKQWAVPHQSQAIIAQVCVWLSQYAHDAFVWPKREFLCAWNASHCSSWKLSNSFP